MCTIRTRKTLVQLQCITHRGFFFLFFLSCFFTVFNVLHLIFMPSFNNFLTGVTRVLLNFPFSVGKLYVFFLQTIIFMRVPNNIGKLGCVLTSFQLRKMEGEPVLGQQKDKTGCHLDKIYIGQLLKSRVVPIAPCMPHLHNFGGRKWHLWFYIKHLAVLSDFLQDVVWFESWSFTLWWLLLLFSSETGQHSSHYFFYFPYHTIWQWYYY